MDWDRYYENQKLYDPVCFETHAKMGKQLWEIPHVKIAYTEDNDSDEDEDLSSDEEEQELNHVETER